MIGHRPRSLQLRLAVILGATVPGLFAQVAAADPEYQFTLVEAFSLGYDLRECYIWDLNDVGSACGTSTREYQVPNGTSIAYSGFTWDSETEKSPLDATTLPRGINNTGWVVGERSVIDLASGSVLATIPYPPGGVSTMEAMGVNDAGTAVGYAQTCVCSNSNRVNQIPFVWDLSHGTRAVPVPGAKELIRVNNHNVAVGIIRGGPSSAFTYDIDSGAFTILSQLLPPGPFGAVPTNGYDINDAGQVVGDLSENGYRRGFVWSPTAGFTVFTSFGGITNADVYAKGINNRGDVVGYAQFDPAQPVTFHAFVWDTAQGIRDLNLLARDIPSGFILDRSLKINDRGWIVGDGHFGPGWSTSRAFVLKPLTAAPCQVDFNNDGDVGTDADIEAFFACLAGACCPTCGSADFDNDGDTGTDADIEAFFRVLGGGNC